ncbi:ABC transporter substrate-binding protein [Paenibacillus pini]|uniref:Multiple sugar ABC transporter n=1 Tax=Paenibacillus pini JCM 16418 TaxID=1236976 RepID=W7YDA8_9BACL|nr:ABC transporter substrate-binding protein [Paenibacillus pini]GAF08905.1 hypothetical protein JCM16418_3015 [Paenibacillus pini JCM 16418]
MTIRKKHSIVTIMLVMLMILSGCSGNDAGSKANDGKTNTASNTASKNAAGTDTSDDVNLVFYLLGEAPAGMDAVVKELNKKMKADINSTVEFRYIGWGDLASKYPLVLAAGEDVDLIYSANWAYYNQEAAKGAFRELTKEDLQKFMPLHHKATPEKAWKEAEVNGKIFMVPTATPDQKVPVTLIRGDLRKKYGVPEIKKFSDLEPYLDAIKKNEKGMIPINMDSQYDYGKVFTNLQNEMGPASVDAVLVTNGWTGTATEWDDPEYKVHSIFEPYMLESYKGAAKIAKSWYDNGYLNKNAISNTVRSKDAFEQGKSAVGIGNSNDIQSTLAKADEMVGRLKLSRTCPKRALTQWTLILTMV